MTHLSDNKTPRKDAVFYHETRTFSGGWSPITTAIKPEGKFRGTN